MRTELASPAYYLCVLSCLFSALPLLAQSPADAPPVAVNITNHPSTDRFPAWSPDGSKIAFASLRRGNFEIYSVNADGTDLVRLSDHAAPDFVPAWSPDGTKIAFESGRDRNQEVYLMNADGTGLVNLTNHPASDGEPAWSPDGRKIAFTSNRDGPFEIFTVNADGADPVNLTSNPAFDSDPEFSADGRLAFASDRDNDLPDIFVIDANGANLVGLIDSPAFDVEMAFSPDGSKLAFVSLRDGDPEIYVVDISQLLAGPDTAIGAENTASPSLLALEQNAPNPFNSATAIRFSLPARAWVDLAVFNLAGQRLITLLVGERQAGFHTVSWDGRDARERALATGMYLYRLQAGDRSQTRKLLLLR